MDEKEFGNINVEQAAEIAAAAAEKAEAEETAVTTEETAAVAEEAVTATEAPEAAIPAAAEAPEAAAADPVAAEETAAAAEEAMAVDPEATQGIDEAEMNEARAAAECNFDYVTDDGVSETAGSTAEEAADTAFNNADSSAYNEAGGFDRSYNAAPSYQYASPEPPYSRSAAKSHPGYITKRACVLLLILTLLLSLLASTGINTAYTTYINKKANENGHATNYTLTTSDESLSFKSVIKKTQDSVVSITTESVTNDMWMQNYVTQGAGSGVIIQSDGYIITCEHVISGARKITVTLKDGKEYPAEIIGADAANDIAVIKIDAKGLQEATYGDSSKLEVGDQVVAIGNPLGTLSGTATTGIISALNRNLSIDNRTLNLLQTDASINPGNSGGGLFDTSGNLIGIVEAKSTGSDIDGLGFATPINKAAKIAKEIIKKGGDVSTGKGGSSANRVMIGIMVAPVEDSTAKQYGYSHGGLLIKSVNSEEASKAGLQTGDIIYKADGKTIKTNEDLSKVLAKKKEGDTVKLTVARENGFDSEITTRLISQGTQN